MKRWLTGAVIGSMGIGLLFLIFWWSGLFSKAIRGAEAVPADAIAIYQGAEPLAFYNKLKSSSVAQVLKPAKGFQEVDKVVQKLDSFTKKAAALFHATHKHPSYYISLHKTSLDELGVLLSWQSQISEPLSAVDEKLREQLPGLSTKRREFGAHTVIDYYKHGNAILTISQHEGILLAGTQSILVEDALRQLTNKAFDEFSGLQTKPSQEDQLYINFREFPNLLSIFTKSPQHKGLKKTTSLPGYARYHVQVHEDGIQLSGPFHLIDSANLAATTRKAPAARHFEKVVPLQVAFLHAFSLPEPQPGNGIPFRKRQRFQPEPQAIDSLEAWYGFNLNKAFRPLLGHQVCLAINEPITPDFSKQTFAVMHYRDTASAFQSLRAFADKQGQHPLTTTTFQRMTYRGYRMEQLAVGEAFPMLLGPLFSYLENPYYTTIADCAVLARNPATLKRIIDDYKAGQTLENDPNYTNLKGKLFPRSQQFTYIHPGRARQLGLSFLDPAFKQVHRQCYPYYSRFSGLAFQLKADTMGLFSQVTLMRKTTSETLTQKVWEQSLGAPLASAPQKVINPKNRTPEILVTDQAEHLYLLKNDGDIQWKKPLVTEKMGPVDTIDLYQNGNQQFLFATRGKLHLLDHEGQEVGGFPISLSAPAVSEVRAYNLDGPDNYQYFIGCQNNKVYGYQSGGSPLDGWSPAKVDAPLSFPVKYYRYRGKLRLFSVTRTGKLYVWNRSGQVKQKWDFDTRFTHPFSMHFGATDSTTYLVSTDTSGIAHMLYLNGDTVQRRFGNFTRQHHFLLADLNRDGAETLIFAEERKLQGYLPDGTREFTITLRDSLGFGPKVYEIGGRLYLGYGSATKNRIYLIDPDGNPFRGFPLKGRTPFLVADMNRDNAKELVVGGKNDNLIMYQIE